MTTGDGAHTPSKQPWSTHVATAGRGLLKGFVGLALVILAIGATVGLVGHRSAPTPIDSSAKVEALLETPGIIGQDATRRVIVTTLRAAVPKIPSVPAGDGHPVIPEIPGTDPSLVTCTEPSPDALSAISASVAASGGLSNQAAAAIEAGLRQSVAGIGLRTQSIQMLRDQGFRVCEAYASGAIDKLDYRQLLRRSQVFTTAILAIEQLTSATKAQPVTVGGDEVSDVTDRERKLPDYRTIPSLEDILVVSSTEPRIEHYRREQGGWKVSDLRGQGTLHLEAFGITVDLAELYAGVLRPGDAQARGSAGA
jgi:Putative restriction endonuclease